MSVQRLANLLGATGLAVTDELKESLAHTGTAVPTELAAVITVANYPGQPIEAMRRTLGLTHSGAVRLVDRLESSGLVSRAPTGHGRTVAVNLTRTGLDLAAQIRRERLTRLSDVVAVLDEQDQQALTSLLERILAELTDDRASARRICRLCDEPTCETNASCPVDIASTPNDKKAS
jgi:MarR family transcriptional regulator, negative regulator of the multidrug operon emrRAB